MQPTNPFLEFFKSEKAAGFILIFCTAFSLLLANTAWGNDYAHLWHLHLFSKPLEFWINDAFMAVFFLLVGLEIKRELFIGELSSLQKATLPVLAALGGMLLPALIHFLFNRNTATATGFGIPMATDIAFSLGILSLLGNKVPTSLKVFLTALAIIDDLGAILIIAIFYSAHISLLYLGLAASFFVLMLLLSKFKVDAIWIYLLLGCGLWFCMYRSGIHATISGVLLAFAIPFRKGNPTAASSRLEHLLHKPVSFLVLPLFALTNTAIFIPPSFASGLLTANSLGILLGLLLGKPLGVFLFSIIGVGSGLCVLPDDVKTKHLLGVGLLAGIGFTMSIFITLLAFNDSGIINSSKIATIVASVLAGTLGFVWLKATLTRSNEYINHKGTESTKLPEE